MYSYKHLIRELHLVKHPEGGYFRETYRSRVMIDRGCLPSSFSGNRHASTSIYFLLPSNERSLFHKIKSDEIWNYHAGSSLSIYVLNENGLSILKLGSDIANGEQYQVVVPAHSWFGAICDDDDSFTLSGCTVAPGFDFADFELADRNQLLRQYPSYRTEIILLTNASS
jgi:uncharacterized protein